MTYPMSMSSVGEGFARSTGNPTRLLSRAPMAMPDGSGASTAAQAALAALQGGPAEVRSLLIDYRNALAGAHSNTAANRNLTPAGMAQAMNDLRAQLQAQYQAQAQGLAARYATATRTLDAAAEAAVPDPQTGVEAMLARQAAWQRARTLLDANIPADQLVREATDPEELWMLHDEVPTYLRAKGMAEDAMRYFWVCEQRQWAELADTAQGEGDILADMAAVPYEAYLEPLVAHMLAETAGQAAPGGYMEAGIRAELARQQAQAVLTGGFVTNPDPNAGAD